MNETFYHPTPRNATMKAWVEENDDDEALIEWDFIEDVVAARLE